MKRKGFTLIELIAVIVILAIIALVAIPVITGIINKSKKGAAEASALNYIDAVEKYVMLHDLDSVKYPYDLRNNTFNVSSNTEVSLLDIIIPKAKAEGTVPSLNSFINIKGEKPKSGTVTIDKKGKVTEADLLFGKFNVECTGNSCEAKGGNTPKVTLRIVSPESTNVKISKTVTLTVDTNSNDKVTWTSSDDTIATVENGVVTGIKPGNVTITVAIGSVTDTIELTVKGGPTIYIGDIYSSTNVKQLGVLGYAYLNPINGHISDQCSAVQTTGIETSGCMKWYIYSETDTTYTMILDHNIQNGVKWNNSSSSFVDNYSSSRVNSVINSLNWDSSILEKRIISKEEVEAIVNKTITSNTKLEKSSDQSITSSYAWLYDYTYICTNYRCNIALNNSNARGYWTSTQYDGYNLWYITNNELLAKETCTTTNIGVRPVITISKTIFN